MKPVPTRAFLTAATAAVIAALQAPSSVFAQVAQAPAVPESDADALDLANRSDGHPVARARDWHAFVEAATLGTQPRSGDRVEGARLSADVRVDRLVAPGWRFVFADRVDLLRQWAPTTDRQTNTLKELYVGWQPDPRTTLEAGRINLRNGVALGYNPTDFFKTDALRSVTSIDPASLRENRLGTVMLRAQRLWEGGAVSALYAPRLVDASRPGDLGTSIGTTGAIGSSTGAATGASDWSPDWQATNRGARWLLAASHAPVADVKPQWLIHGGDGVATQVGLNLSRLFGDATTAFFELSGGREPSLRSRLEGTPGDGRLRHRLSTGFTYTTSANLSVTLEYDYNAAAEDRDGLRELARRPDGLLARYLSLAAARQDLASRHGAFMHLTWQNAIVRRLDLSAMQRIDLDRASRLSWAEVRYRFERFDLALQWQRYGGAPDSVFGAVPTQRAMQLLGRFYF